MEHFAQQRTVAADLETCWTVLTDPARGPEWLTFVSEASARGEPGVGRELIARGSLLGLSMQVHQTVDRWEPPTGYGWRGERPFPLAVSVDLAALDATTTEVEARVATDPGRFFPVGRRVALRTLRGQFARSADALVALVEAEASDGAAGRRR